MFGYSDETLSLVFDILRKQRLLRVKAYNIPCNLFTGTYSTKLGSRYLVHN